MSNRVISMRSRERKASPGCSFDLNRPPVAGYMNARSWTTTVVVAIVILVAFIALLGIAKTAVLLAKVYLAIFALLFLAAFLTGGSGSRLL